MGRPTKLTPQVQAAIIKAIKGGNYVVVAAQYAGIDPAQFYRWKERGERATKGIYFDFVQALKDAEAFGEVQAVSEVRLAGPDNWQAAMTFLERRHHERWARREAVEVSGEITGTVEHRIFMEAAERIYAERQASIDAETIEPAQLTEGDPDGTEAGEDRAD